VQVHSFANNFIQHSLWFLFSDAPGSSLRRPIQSKEALKNEKLERNRPSYRNIGSSIRVNNPKSRKVKEGMPWVVDTRTFCLLQTKSVNCIRQGRAIVLPCWPHCGM